MALLRLGSLSSGLGLASLHVDASTPSCVIQESQVNPTGWQLEMFNGRTVPIKNGYAELPRWPGLGLQLNEEVARKHPHSNPNPSYYFEDGSVADY